MASLTDHGGFEVAEDAVDNGDIVLTDNVQVLADRAPYRPASIREDVATTRQLPVPRL